eukprot:gene12223-8411_t
MFFGWFYRCLSLALADVLSIHSISSPPSPMFIYFFYFILYSIYIYIYYHSIHPTNNPWYLFVSEERKQQQQQQNGDETRLPPLFPLFVWSRFSMIYALNKGGAAASSYTEFLRSTLFLVFCLSSSLTNKQTNKKKTVIFIYFPPPFSYHFLFLFFIGWHTNDIVLQLTTTTSTHTFQHARTISAVVSPEQSIWDALRNRSEAGKVHRKQGSTRIHTNSLCRGDGECAPPSSAIYHTLRVCACCYACPLSPSSSLSVALFAPALRRQSFTPPPSPSPSPPYRHASLNQPLHEPVHQPPRGGRRVRRPRPHSHPRRPDQAGAEGRQGQVQLLSDLVYCNIGNPQSLQQKPLTFYRQVMSLIDAPFLLENPAIVSQYPADVIARAKEYLSIIGGATGAYTESSGYPFARQAVADYINNRDNKAEPLAKISDIFLTDGASAGVKLIMNILIGGPTDAAMIPLPQYPLYTAQMALLDGKVAPYYLQEAECWGVQAGDLAAAYEESVAKNKSTPRMMVVINPGNPTGAVLERGVMEEIVKFCCDKSMVVVADEVYQENIYVSNKKFVSFRDVVCRMPEPYRSKTMLVSLHSTSKGIIGECGRRGGYMELLNIPEALREQIVKMSSINLCSNVNGQIMTALMCSPPKKGDASYDAFTKEYNGIFDSLKKRADMLTTELNKITGFSCQKSEGAMYAFPTIVVPKGFEAHNAELNAKEGRKLAVDARWALELLEESGIVVVPGSGFGQMPNTLHFRTTILPPMQQMERMVKSIKAFQEGLYAKYNGLLFGYFQSLQSLFAFHLSGVREEDFWVLPRSESKSEQIYDCYYDFDSNSSMYYGIEENANEITKMRYTNLVFSRKSFLTTYIIHINRNEVMKAEGEKKIDVIRKVIRSKRKTIKRNKQTKNKKTRDEREGLLFSSLSLVEVRDTKSYFNDTNVVSSPLFLLCFAYPSSHECAYAILVVYKICRTVLLYYFLSSLSLSPSLSLWRFFGAAFCCHWTTPYMRTAVLGLVLVSEKEHTIHRSEAKEVLVKHTGSFALLSTYIYIYIFIFILRLSCVLLLPPPPPPAPTPHIPIEIDKLITAGREQGN